MIFYHFVPKKCVHHTFCLISPLAVFAEVGHLLDIYKKVALRYHYRSDIVLFDIA